MGSDDAKKEIERSTSSSEKRKRKKKIKKIVRFASIFRPQKR
jgi:hypothetical protein